MKPAPAYSPKPRPAGATTKKTFVYFTNIPNIIAPDVGVKLLKAVFSGYPVQK
jgi:hypothetical protein